ncbi:hypothetical protein N0V85_000651 [Neurospora sp. IMI 360204]|nr:hypothetical protein N0V85_000651 [Neurospora sp. IMI 360204]
MTSIPHPPSIHTLSSHNSNSSNNNNTLLSLSKVKRGRSNHASPASQGNKLNSNSSRSNSRWPPNSNLWSQLTLNVLLNSKPRLVNFTSLFKVSSIASMPTHAVPVSAAGTSTLGGATANAATNNTINFNALLDGGGGGESSATGGVSGIVNGDHHHHDDSGANVVTHHQEDMDNDVDDDDDEESRQLQLLSANLVGDQSLPSVSWGVGDNGGASSGSGAAGFDMAYPPQGHIFHIQLSTSAGGKNYVGGGPNGASVVVNNWTRQHGYRVITRRSKIKNDRYHLTMSCALSGNKYRPVPGPTQEQIEEARRNGQRKPYQRRIGTDKCNCPFRFVLRETAKHSSTFEVRWTMVGPGQQPANHNHGPDPKALVGDE